MCREDEKGCEAERNSSSSFLSVLNSTEMKKNVGEYAPSEHK